MTALRKILSANAPSAPRGANGEMRGRKTLLTRALQERICALLADANTIAASCEAQGIGVSTYHEWQHKYPDFVAATTRARAQARIKLVKEIKRCSCDDWRGWAWLAERMFPSEFARSEPRTIVIERPPPPAVSQHEPPPSRTTNYWTTGDEIPFTREQLAYIAEMRTRYADAPPSKRPNGKGEDDE